MLPMRFRRWNAGGGHFYFCISDRFWQKWISAMDRLHSPLCCDQLPRYGASRLAQMVKRLPAMRETWVRSRGWKHLLEKEMATHSNVLAWRIPQTEEPGRLQSMGSQGVGHDWATSLSLFLSHGYGAPVKLAMVPWLWVLAVNSCPLAQSYRVITSKSSSATGLPSNRTTSLTLNSCSHSVALNPLCSIPFSPRYLKSFLFPARNLGRNKRWRNWHHRGR